MARESAPATAFVPEKRFRMKHSRTPSRTGVSFHSLLCSTAVLAFSAMVLPAAEGQASIVNVPNFHGTSAALLPAESYSSSDAAEGSAAALPEAPAPQRRTDGTPLPPAGTKDSETLAPRTAGVIYAGQRGIKQTARDKVALGVEELIDPEGLAAMILSAGYEHAGNSQPNYGTDKGAFGERLGAAAIREESQSVFTYMVFAPVLHEDARYYVEGPSHNLVQRTLYAVTRPLITRTDGGRQTINGALLLGYAASAALTPAYYPSSNRNVHDVLAVYGGSIGGSALGFFVNEFTDDALMLVHLKHRPQ